MTTSIYGRDGLAFLVIISVGLVIAGRPSLATASDVDTSIEFGDWIVSVSTSEASALPGGAESFVRLARECPGWENVLAQLVWIGDFDEDFVAAEPRPMCAFLAGNYSKCIGERGKFNIRKTANDPVFEGLPEVFEMMESHIGQIAWPPNGWMRIATKGPGALTVNQCLRVKDRPIYAAQFHMEMVGTPENSRRVMGNFLALAKDWGGYNPDGKSVPIPESLSD